MTCLTCRFVATPGVQGHTALRCPLRRQLQCRYHVSNEHPFYPPGPCLSKTCSHAKQCAVCGLLGHTSHSLALRPTRWRLPHGRVDPLASLEVPIITGIDFMRPLVGDRQARRMVAAVHDLALSER